MKTLVCLGLILVLITGCSSTPSPRLTVNGHAFDLELALTETEQAKGLSGHQALGDREGMLFVFKSKSVKTFWMKDMLFPIDIVWLDDHKIVKISKSLQPEGASPIRTYSSDLPVNYVLEVAAGTADKLNLKVGDKVNYEY